MLNILFNVLRLKKDKVVKEKYRSQNGLDEKK